MKLQNKRNESLDHVLFFDLCQVGKDYSCGIIANEMGVGIKITSRPVIEKKGEMVILNNLQGEMYCG